jgi:hypothetical protein
MPLLDVSIAQMFLATRTLLNDELIPPALVLFYSTIDSLASLGRPASVPYVERDDFIRWVNRYLLSQAFDFQCSAIDLYAARCRVLHTHAPESKLSDKGRARSISYAWGASSLSSLRTMLVLQDRSSTMVGEHLGALVEASELGYESFVADIHATPALRALIEQRAKPFAEVPDAVAKRDIARTKRRS